MIKTRNKAKNSLCINRFTVAFATFVSVIVVALTTSGVVSAAGSVSVTVESASGSYLTGSTNALSLYGTTSGANTSGFHFTVTLTNMTIDHFDSSGAPFSLVLFSDGAAGSTSITITPGYTNPAGGAGKLLVGKLYTVASASPDTATATISGIEAADANLDPMAGSVGSNGSYTITAPVVTPAAPAAVPAKVVTLSKVTVPIPTAAKAAGVTTSEVVPVTKVDQVLTTEAPDVVKTVIPIKKAKKSHKTLYMEIVGGVLVLAGLGTGVFVLLRRRAYTHKPAIVVSTSAADASQSAAVTKTPTPMSVIMPTNVVANSTSDTQIEVATTSPTETSTDEATTGLPDTSTDGEQPAAKVISPEVKPPDSPLSPGR